MPLFKLKAIQASPRLKFAFYGAGFVVIFLSGAFLMNALSKLALPLAPQANEASKRLVPQEHSAMPPKHTGVEVRQLLPEAKRSLIEDLKNKAFWTVVFSKLIFGSAQERLAIENQFLYNPQAAAEIPPHQEVLLPSEKLGEAPLRLLYERPSKPDGTVMVYFPGNAENMMDGYTRTVKSGWLKQGNGFITLQYPGYGTSKELETPSQNKLFAAADRMANYLSQDQKLPPVKQVAVGYSLGTTVATHYASVSPQPVKALFLVAPLASTPAMVEAYGQAAGLPSWLYQAAASKITQTMNSEVAIKNVSCPVVSFHGTADVKCPINQSERLLKAATGTKHKELVTFNHTDHEGILYTNYPEQIVEKLNKL